VELCQSSRMLRDNLHVHLPRPFVEFVPRSRYTVPAMPAALIGLRLHQLRETVPTLDSNSIRILTQNEGLAQTSWPRADVMGFWPACGGPLLRQG
jgi:hypothetical protein